MRSLLGWLTLLALILLAGCGGHTHRAVVAHGYHTRYGVQAHSPTFGRPTNRAGVVAPALVPSVEMFDSVNVAQIPLSSRAVAGYTSGFWPTFPTLVQRFPSAFRLSVAINAGLVADCLDVEPGDAVPAQAPGWVHAMLRLGHWRPCLYTSISEFPAVNAYLSRAGIARGQVREWDADWTYSARLDAGFDATQWTNHSQGRNLDESTVALSFFGAAPKPRPHPKPHPKRIHCFGRHYNARHHARVCDRIRPLTSRRSRARNASRRQLHAHACQRPYRRGVCRTLARRERWFARKVRDTIRKYG